MVDVEAMKNDICKDKPGVLLHSCCGPCSTACIERLTPDYKVTVFYYNPCITDHVEYEKRKNEQVRYLSEIDKNTKIEFIEGDYDIQQYFDLIDGLEDEPEGGERCSVCFAQRLTATAELAVKMKIPFFTTTLTVSPHKNYGIISEIGKNCEVKGVKFLPIDFKKKAGFQRSIELSKKHNLYRQNYCGCKFSKHR